MVSSIVSFSSRAVRGAVCLLLVLACAGCGLLQNALSPSSPSSPSSNTETFSGAVPQQGSVVAGTFSVSQTGPVSVTLVALSPTPTAAMGLGIGTPNGTSGCTLTTSTSNAIAGLAAQLSVTANPGNFCVSVYDVGNLTSAAAYSVTVTHS
jgi:hypothetical protein